VTWLNNQKSSSLFISTITIGEIENGSRILPAGKRRMRTTPSFPKNRIGDPPAIWNRLTGKNVTEWCEYLYDFGDSWCHDVKLIRVVSDKESFKQRLLAGDRTCPPEDCGGVSGYERVVHFVRTGGDILEDAPEGLRTWLGGWKPNALDLTAAKEKFDR